MEKIDVTFWDAGLQDCMVGLLFAFMPVLANNRSGGEVDHFDVLRLLFRLVLALPTLLVGCAAAGS